MSDRKICRGCKQCKEAWIDLKTHFYCEDCIKAFAKETSK
jgi:hypothetical protein